MKSLLEEIFMSPKLFDRCVEPIESIKSADRTKIDASAIVFGNLVGQSIFTTEYFPQSENAFGLRNCVVD